MEPQKLIADIERHNVSMMQATPSTWRMLVDHGWPAHARPLTVLCGGEALSAQLLQQLLKHTPKVWNMYGPTETTIWSAVNCLTSNSKELSLGYPIANTKTLGRSRSRIVWSPGESSRRNP